MFEHRHFDIKKKSWHIGSDHEAEQKIITTITEFYQKLNKIIEISEEIRELNKDFKIDNSSNILTNTINRFSRRTTINRPQQDISIIEEKEEDKEAENEEDLSPRDEINKNIFEPA